MVPSRPQRSWSAPRIKLRPGARAHRIVNSSNSGEPAGPFRHRAATIRCAPGRAARPWCAAKHRSLAPRLPWLGRNGEQVLFQSALRGGAHWKPVAVRLRTRRRIARKGPALTSTPDTGRQLGFIGGVLGLPSLLVWTDGPAYRKTVPTVILLLARTRVKLAQKQRAGEARRMA